MTAWPALDAYRAAFPQQASFCGDAARFVVANAAIRTGKTYSAARKFINRVLLTRQRYAGALTTFWCIAPTFEEGVAQKIELASLIPNAEIDWTRQQKDTLFRNLKRGGGKLWLHHNALIEFKSADRPEGLVARKVHGVWWTEIARSKYAAWPNVRGRLANTQGWLIADTSPFGHSWFYNDVLKPAYAGSLPDVSVHRWTALDSPFIPRAEVEAARASLPKAFFERDYMASDDVFMGQIYDVDDALHLQSACPFTPERAVLAADVNTTSTHPAEFVWALVRGTGHDVQAWIEGAYKRVIGLDYAVYAQDIARHAADLKTRFPRVDVVIDPSMHRELKQMLSRCGVSPRNAVNDVLPGVRTLGSALMPGAAQQPRLTFSPAAREAYDQLKAQRWVVDGDGIVKARPDKTLDDGWCFQRDTLVRMADGTNMHIGCVRPGDMVATPCGPQPVLAAGLTRLRAPIVSVTINGQRFGATHDHAFLCERPGAGVAEAAGLQRAGLLGLREGVLLAPDESEAESERVKGQRASVAAPHGVGVGARAYSSRAPYPSQKREPSGQPTGEFGVPARSRAPSPSYDLTEAPSPVTGVHQEGHCGSPSVAQVAGGLGVAQAARGQRSEKLAAARLHLRGVRQELSKQIPAGTRLPFLSLELQDDVLSPDASGVHYPVEAPNEGVADVYCITVPCGWFVLANGLIVKNCDALRYLAMDVFSGYAAGRVALY